MSTINRQIVLKHLAIAFPDPLTAAEATAALDLYGQQSVYEPFRDKIHLAIIALSFGSLPRLRELVAEARSDFRNVLFPAQKLLGWGAILR
jgi:hypothetical protein